MKNIMIGCSARTLTGGGIKTYVKELIDALLELNFNIFYVSPKQEDDSWFYQVSSDYFVTDPLQNQCKTAKALLEFIKHKRIDGIINNDNPILQSLAPMVDCSFISVGHLNKLSIASVACYQMDYVDYLVAISSDMHKKFVKNYNVPAQKCVIVHNGIKDIYRKELSERQNDDPLRIVYAGGISHRKGGDIIIKLLQETRQDWKGIEFEWFGRLPDKYNAKLSKNTFLNINAGVPRNEFLQSLSKADVFLMPSRSEGCPMAMIEAMCLGVIPIASDGVGAMRWLISHGTHGYICHLDNWVNEALACISSLKNDHQKVLHMKQLVRKRYLDEFQIKFVAERLVHLLKQPTVKRSQKPNSIEILRWHRPQYQNGKKKIKDEICWKLGILQKEGILER